MTDNAKTIPPEKMAGMKFHFKAGWGGYPLVGTPDKIVNELESLSSLGVDGVVLSWVDYRRGLDVWRNTVAPLLEQTGLRHATRVPALQ